MPSTKDPKNSFSALKIFLEFGLLSILAFFIFLCFAKKVDFSIADLGRHIMNGQVFFEQFRPIETNFYSYTQPDHPTINHHWGTGVIFYLIHNALGFEGLSLFNILLYLIAILTCFFIAKSKSNMALAFFFTTVSIPLLGFRTEIRPETISCVFMAIFLAIIYLYQKEKINFSVTLFTLCLLEILWVNLHLFFIFGPIIIGSFWLGELAKKKFFPQESTTHNSKQFFTLLLATSLVTLINPMGLSGALKPFNIFDAYGYELAENMGVLFMCKRFPESITYPYFIVIFSFFLIILTFVVFKKKAAKFIPEILLTLFIGYLACTSIRMISTFALFFIPFISSAVYSLFFQENKQSKRYIGINTTLILLSLIFIVFCFLTNIHNLSVKRPPHFGLGLYPNSNHAAEFFKSLKIKGPILNNYDIGGYLIYNLFPEHKVFVDNRPEAYSANFFTEVYKPLQESEEVWQSVDQKYKFNTIFFQRHDHTMHAQPFLIRRLRDENWIPVYVDNWNIILLRRNQQNKRIIDKHELPLSTFVIKENN